MDDEHVVFRLKADENLAAAQSEHANRRYNSCANRAYYACFHAAVAALAAAGVRPLGQWGHDFVAARFVGDLINRRKRYPAELRTDLVRLRNLREIADYRLDFVSETQATRALRRATAFVGAIEHRGDGEP